jgi:arginine-tRNA-protein transferase
MDGGVYQRLMDAGFRRSGRVVYQPMCRGCRACLPIRVPVEAFRPSRSQRRVLRRNGDLVLRAGRPEPTRQKFELYQRYQTQWHEGTMAGTWDDFLDFLYRSPVDSIETEVRGRDGRLLGVGVCDVTPGSLSSVYFYFDPAESSRSLGTWSILQEIELAGRLRRPFYYLGYWVAGCGKMQYKSAFHPHEVLYPDGRWHSVGGRGTSGARESRAVEPVHVKRYTEPSGFDDGTAEDAG